MGKPFLKRPTAEVSCTTGPGRRPGKEHKLPSPSWSKGRITEWDYPPKRSFLKGMSDDNSMPMLRGDALAEGPVATLPTKVAALFEETSRPPRPAARVAQGITGVNPRAGKSWLRPE